MALVLVCAAVLTAVLREPGYFIMAVVARFAMYWFSLIADE